MSASGYNPINQARCIMLAEKFFLVLETLRSNRYPDEGPRVKSTSPHVPIELPTKVKRGRLNWRPQNSAINFSGRGAFSVSGSLTERITLLGVTFQNWMLITLAIVVVSAALRDILRRRTTSVAHRSIAKIDGPPSGGEDDARDPKETLQAAAFRQ